MNKALLFLVADLVALAITTGYIIVDARRREAAEKAQKAQREWDEREKPIRALAALRGGRKR